MVNQFNRHIREVRRKISACRYMIFKQNTQNDIFTLSQINSHFCDPRRIRIVVQNSVINCHSDNFPFSKFRQKMPMYTHMQNVPYMGIG